MRHFLVLFILFITVSLGAQPDFTIKSSNSGGFDVESGTTTSETFQVEGKTFDVFTTKSGSKYVKGISKSGKQYPIWIGEETEHTFNYEGKEYPVRVFKSGSYCFFLLSSKGYPYPRWLEVND